MNPYTYSSQFSLSIEEYTTFREATGYSLNHAKLLKRFDQYCMEFCPNATQLTKDVVRGWFDYEISRGFTGLENKASAIRGFAKYVGGNAYILPYDIVPKSPNFTPYILTDEELYRLFEAIDRFHCDNDPFLSKTLSVMFRLIYACGLRPNEGRNINISHVDFVTGELLITKTKRNKERIIVASDEMMKTLCGYLAARKMVPSDADELFVRGNGEPLTAWHINHYFKVCWVAANPDIPKEQLPHLRIYDLRHRFASKVLQKWLDERRNLYAMLPYLRSYMGHVRFEDTAYYIHLLPDRLIKSPGVNWNAIDQTGLEADIWTH